MVLKFVPGTMRAHVLAACVVVLSASPLLAYTQGAAATSPGLTPGTAAVPAKQTSTAHRRTTKPKPRSKPTVSANSSVQTIRLETAPPSPPTNESTLAAQRAADQRLLQQQQAQSDKAAQVNNQEVRQAEQQQNKVQNEVRIQDAPGPQQTGILPGVPPAAPSQGDEQRIQDAPGPAQTLPQPAPPPAPATQPQSAPPQG